LGNLKGNILFESHTLNLWKNLLTVCCERGGIFEIWKKILLRIINRYVMNTKNSNLDRIEDIGDGVDSPTQATSPLSSPLCRGKENKKCNGLISHQELVLN